MLEILSHQHLKRFIKFHQSDWDHIYSFGRIVSKCLQTNENYLINSEIFSTNENWFSPLLISLFLFEENTTFVLSQKKIEFIKRNCLKDLKNFGFNFILQNDQIIFSNHRICFATLDDFLIDSNFLRHRNHRIVFSGIENIKNDLKNYFRISLFKIHWLDNEKSSSINQKIAAIYNFLKNN